MPSRFENIVAKAEEFQGHWSNVIDFIHNAEGQNGEKFNREATIPGIEHSLLELDERALAISNLLLSLQSSTATTPLPSIFINELQTTTNQLPEHANSIIVQINTINSNGGISGLNPSNWIITAKNNGQQINFASLFQSINSIIESCFINYYRIGTILNSEGFNIFSEAIQSLSRRLDESRQLLSEMREDRENSEQLLQAIQQNSNESQNNNQQISSILETIKTLHQEIQNYYSNSHTTFDEITEINSGAKELEKSVSAYDDTFKQFQQLLSSRNDEYEKSKQKTKELIQQLEQKDNTADDLIKRSNDMLKGATNAGLASAFNNALTDFNKKQQWAQGMFYFSIFFLLISAVPLAYYLFSPVFGAILAGDFSSEKLTALTPLNLDISKTIALVLLMIPAVWLTRFSAARHHHLFQLKEHYQYKYSLAMAVEGFKKQAPTYEDEIAAATFFELTFNPADKLEDKGVARHPNPIMNKFMDKFGLNHTGKIEG